MALHGSVGENGKLQATFDILGIRYTGPNSLGCSLSMNKLVAKQIFKMSRVATPRGTSRTARQRIPRLTSWDIIFHWLSNPCSGGSQHRCIYRSHRRRIS